MLAAMRDLVLRALRKMPPAAIPTPARISRVKTTIGKSEPVPPDGIEDATTGPIAVGVASTVCVTPWVPVAVAVAGWPPLQPLLPLPPEPFGIGGFFSGKFTVASAYCTS